MSFGFASAKLDFDAWKATAVRKNPGSKDRLSRMQLVQHEDLKNIIQRELVSVNTTAKAPEVARYVYVGKCSAEHGYNAILSESIPRTSLYQQVKAAVSLHQVYIVDLDTVPDSELGLTEEALVRRCAGSYLLNALPPKNRYIFLVIFNTCNVADNNAPAQNRPATAPVQVQQGKLGTVAQVKSQPQVQQSLQNARGVVRQNVATDKVSNAVTGNSATKQRPNSIAMAPQKAPASTQINQPQANVAAARRGYPASTAAASAPAPAQVQTAFKPQQQTALKATQHQQTLKQPNVKQPIQVNTRPVTAPLQRVTSAPPNNRTTPGQAPVVVKPQNRRYY